MSAKKKVVLAYSGGLDTSYCVPYLRESTRATQLLFAAGAAIALIPLPVALAYGFA